MKLSLWIFIRDVIVNESKWSLESGVAYEFLDFAEAAVNAAAAYHCKLLRKEVTGWFTLNSAPHMTMRWSARVVKPVDWKLLNRLDSTSDNKVGWVTCKMIL